VIPAAVVRAIPEAENEVLHNPARDRVDPFDSPERDQMCAPASNSSRIAQSTATVSYNVER
jgi:hypothetical protein